MTTKFSSLRVAATGFILGLGLMLITAVSAQAATCSSSISLVPIMTISGTGCTFGENVNGFDNGSITVQTGSSVSLGANQVLAFSNSIVLSGTASIAQNITAGQRSSIKKGYIYVTDADGDGYRVNSASDAVFSTAASGGVAGKVRLQTALSGTDTNDAQSCASAANPGACTQCVNGAYSIITAGTDPKSECNFAGWNGCPTLCQKSTTQQANCSGVAVASVSRCQNAADSGGTAFVAAGMICSGGSEVAGACAAGYTCNGSGGCCYTDIYGQHCIW